MNTSIFDIQESFLKYPVPFNFPQRPEKDLHGSKV